MDWTSRVGQAHMQIECGLGRARGDAMHMRLDIEPALGRPARLGAKLSRPMSGCLGTSEEGQMAANRPQNMFASIDARLCMSLGAHLC